MGRGSSRQQHSGSVLKLLLSDASGTIWIPVLDSAIVQQCPFLIAAHIAVVIAKPQTAQKAQVVSFASDSDACCNTARSIEFINIHTTVFVHSQTASQAQTLSFLRDSDIYPNTARSLELVIAS